MPNYLETTEIITRYLKARVPLIVVKSTEPVRVFSILRTISTNIPSLPFFYYSAADGLRELASNQLVLEDQSLAAALDQAKTMFKARRNVNFIFTEIDHLDSDTPTARHFCQMVRIAEEYQGAIILLADKPVWSGLARLGMSVTLDLPTTEEIFELVSGMMKGHSTAIPVEWAESDMRAAAEILTGITEAEVVNVLATMLVKGAIRAEDLAELSRFKDSIFGELTGIERIRLDDDYHVGGLDNLNAWLKKRKALMKTDLSGTRLHPPKGILLCGVPGCGKSLSAKNIAVQWELPLYRLDMGAILGMYVGESEQNLREALETAERMAPCVLWIDEIEKGLATGSGDSSVTKRLIGQFLFWLQESQAKVFIVATANDVSTLPPELLRKGRFDEIFFVDLPTETERTDIIDLCFWKYTNHAIPSHLVAELAEVSEGFAGSDIDAVVHDIGSEMLFNNTTELPPSDYIRSQFRNVVPFSQTNPEELAAIRDWGRHRAVPAGRTIADSPDSSSVFAGRTIVL